MLFLKGNRMISDSHRFVFLLQSGLKPSVAEMNNVYIKDIAPLLIDRVNKGESLKFYSNETVLYRIRQAYIKDERYLVMLISIGDKNTSDPSFENLKTGQVRNANKTDDEGQSYAAHMIIDLKNSTPGMSFNKVSLERVPGLSSSIIKMFLRQEIKQVFQQKDLDANNTERNYTAILELYSHVSHTLGDALKNGTLKHVSFIQHEVNKVWDEDDYVFEKERHVSIKIKPETSKDKSVSLFNNLIDRFINTSETNKYDTMVVRIKTAQGVTKQNALELNSTENLLSQAFHHQEMIDGFDIPLDASPNNIRDDVVVKMIKLMENKNVK